MRVIESRNFFAPSRDFRRLAWNSAVKHLLLCVILSIMPVRTVGATHRAAHASQVTESPEVRAALNWFSRNLSWINDQQGSLTEIPASPFQESPGAELVQR